MLELLIQYQYIFLFFGLIVLGETVFFPAAYLVYIGEMKFVPVFIIGLAATLIADVVWYFIGKYMPHGKLIQLKVYKKKEEFFGKLMKLFDKHGLRIVLLSKFLYGTRVVSQIVCGMRKIHFWKYFGVNVLAVSILHLGIYALVILAWGGTDVVQNETHKFMLIMTFLVVVVVFLHQWAIRYLRRI